MSKKYENDVFAQEALCQAHKHQNLHRNEGTLKAYYKTK